jgi:hypothetical protein
VSFELIGREADPAPRLIRGLFDSSFLENSPVAPELSEVDNCSAIARTDHRSRHGHSDGAPAEHTRGRVGAAQDSLAFSMEGSAGDMHQCAGVAVHHGDDARDCTEFHALGLWASRHLVCRVRMSGWAPPHRSPYGQPGPAARGDWYGKPQSFRQTASSDTTRERAPVPPFSPHARSPTRPALGAEQVPGTMAARYYGHW